VPQCFDTVGWASGRAYNTGFPSLLENSGKSWIFMCKISRTWKVLENEFGTGKSWKLNFEVLESP